MKAVFGACTKDQMNIINEPIETQSYNVTYPQFELVKDSQQIQKIWILKIYNLDDGRSVVVEANATRVDVYKDGIGGYEFWGYKGYDRGHWCVEIGDFEILSIKDEETNLPILSSNLLMSQQEKDIVSEIYNLLEKDQSIIDYIIELQTDSECYKHYNDDIDDDREKCHDDMR